MLLHLGVAYWRTFHQWKHLLLVKCLLKDLLFVEAYWRIFHIWYAFRSIFNLRRYIEEAVFKCIFSKNIPVGWFFTSRVNIAGPSTYGWQALPLLRWFFVSTSMCRRSFKANTIYRRPSTVIYLYWRRHIEEVLFKVIFFKKKTL